MVTSLWRRRQRKDHKFPQDTECDQRFLVCAYITSVAGGTGTGTQTEEVRERAKDPVNTLCVGRPGVTPEGHGGKERVSGEGGVLSGGGSGIAR